MPGKLVDLKGPAVQGAEAAAKQCPIRSLCDKSLPFMPRPECRPLSLHQPQLPPRSHAPRSHPQRFMREQSRSLAQRTTLQRSLGQHPSNCGEQPVLHRLPHPPLPSALSGEPGPPRMPMQLRQISLPSQPRKIWLQQHLRQSVDLLSRTANWWLVPRSSTCRRLPSMVYCIVLVMQPMWEWRWVGTPFMARPPPPPPPGGLPLLLFSVPP